MKASLITIGDEILIGQVVDTNSAWLGQELTSLGIQVERIFSIADTKEAIIETLEIAQMTSDLILMTGGLGPTKDDITKLALAEYFKVDMIFDKDIYSKIVAYFTSRGIPLHETVKDQCYIPGNARVINNEVGTAPGMLFIKDEKRIISMPGVPHEMKWIFTNSLKPIFAQEFKSDNIIYQKTIRTIGIGESSIENMISDITENMPKEISLAFLPSIGQVRLRLMSRAKEDLKNLVDGYVERIVSRIDRFVFGYDDQTIEEALRDLFIQKSLTLSTAESCTGGYLAHRITSVSGSSKYYLGSFITYDYSLKSKFLAVSEDTLNNHGAVSQETVTEMLHGLLHQTNTDVGISISGIAGPDGGTKEKPVGTVWLAYGSKKIIRTKKLNFSTDRIKNIEYSSIVALDCLRQFVNQEM